MYYKTRLRSPSNQTRDEKTEGRAGTMKGFYIAEDYLDVKFTEATMDIIMFMNSEGRS
jgi:hypothetical protein